MAKSKKNFLTCCDKDMMCNPVGLLIKTLIILGLSLVGTYYLWNWIMVDIFPTGIITSTISWYTAFKLALIMTLCKTMMMRKKHRMMNYFKNK